MVDAEEPLVGEAPSKEELFYIQWGQDALKNELSDLHDTLKQLLTLSTAVTGSIIAFGTGVYWPLKIIAILLLLACVTLAFNGLMPHEATIDLRCVDDIRKARRDTVERKAQRLKLAFVFFVFGIFVAGAGLLFS